MKVFFMCLSLTILLTGCVSFSQMERGLESLVGENSQEAFNVLGYPSAKQEFGNDIVYVWSSSQSGTIFVPQTSTTHGTVGTTPVYGSTTYNQAVPVNYNCLIKLIADQDNTLRKWEYEGNIGGCAKYIRRLNDYYKSKNP